MSCNPIDALNEKLTLLFAEIEMPASGVTKVWLEKIYTLNMITKEEVRIHGMVVAALVSKQVDHLSAASQHTWKIRDFLSELYLTMIKVEAEIGTLPLNCLTHFDTSSFTSTNSPITYIN